MNRWNFAQGGRRATAAVAAAAVAAAGDARDDAPAAGSDELQQQIQLQATALTCALIGAGTFALGLLQGAGLAPLFRDQIIWVLPATLAVWGIVVAIITGRYRND